MTIKKCCGCDSFEEELESCRKEAFEYFSKIGICATPDDILSFVVDCVEYQRGYELDLTSIKEIANILNIEID